MNISFGCNAQSQNSKTNIEKNCDKIVNRDFPERNRNIIFLPYHPPLYKAFLTYSLILHLNVKR